MTARPRILVTRKITDPAEARLEALFDARFNPKDRTYSGDELVALAEGRDGLLVAAGDPLNAKVIGALPDSVRIIATLSVGHEHIDLDAARARGIPVTTTPGGLDNATAEMAMMLILCAARRANEGFRLVREDRWTGWTPTMMLGTEVTGKRLGIVGMGRIGQALARMARGFSMEIHYHNRSRLAPEAESGATYHRDPDSLLEVSDFLSLNCPLTPQTTGFLNVERIAKLPDRAVVVNTARGGVVEDTALIAALRSGKLAAAGLDVFTGEPKIDPAYRALDNVFVMPHLGSATREARDAMGFKCAENLLAFFEGREPPDRVA
ncbi:MAG: D-glycerate dehydrogenase [Rhodospirillaceae bacterium]|jgi:lactate dehydrogenase-like 2-hydroxyacid dehydrogenase|nr:D-glycerate dehydrogenase [Rhodospirillaceae bacterium]